MNNYYRLINRVFMSIYIRGRSYFFRFKYKVNKPIRLKRFAKERWISQTDLISSPSTDINWLFHDENWDLVVNRWSYRSKLMKGEDFFLNDTPQPFSREVTTTDDGVVSVNGQTTTDDEWIFLYLDSRENNWNNYSFKFSIEFETLFKEFQVDFRYLDFFNRYRYRFQSGNLYFDIIYKGEFISFLSVLEFKLETFKLYNIEIKVMGDIFQCWIDGILLSTDFGGNKIKYGAVALIFWEDDGKTDMKVKIHSSSANKLYLK